MENADDKVPPRIPVRRDVLENPRGFPRDTVSPTIFDRGGFQDVLYGIDDIVSDWEGYAAHLAQARPEFHPRVLLISHDMSEIENITLMALGGVVRALNGTVRYLLINPNSCDLIDETIEQFRPDWIGLSLYTGLTDHALAWIARYKKGVKDKSAYAPVIVGGHFNNFDYRTSYEAGANYSVRGKGINLLKDILLGAFPPGIYHDPIPYANIPEFDREGFYRDTFAQSDKMKKYALSPVKSVLTALGCAYRCTYCYIGSLRDNLKESYQPLNMPPPNIIQDRPLSVVLKEGLAIKRLDSLYGVKTTAVFDQADISLNNIEWWRELHSLWTNQVGLPFYIQARPAMLAGPKGVERIEMIAKDNLVAGISMAIESGDPHVRRLLLRRMESNDVLLDAIRNVKSALIPIRTQAITGLPVMRPSRKLKNTDIGLVDRDGKEHYYDDPLEETLKCLDLVCSSGLFSKEDYYWNSIYTPFLGTPLGDYAEAAGFHDPEGEHSDRAYMFTSECGMSCFTDEVARKQVAFHRTANFFAHLDNGKDMMSLFLAGNGHFTLESFASFIDEKKESLKVAKQYSKFGLIPGPTPGMLREFIAHAYVEKEDAGFKDVNLLLLPYYDILLDGLILAAKIADRYFRERAQGVRFNLDHLSRVERNHYYDNSYHMTYIPERYARYLKRFIHENRSGLDRTGSRPP